MLTKLRGCTVHSSPAPTAQPLAGCDTPAGRQLYAHGDVCCVMTVQALVHWPIESIQQVDGGRLWVELCASPKAVEVLTPRPMKGSFLGSGVSAKDQGQMRSFGWALIQQDWGPDATEKSGCGVRHVGNWDDGVAVVGLEGSPRGPWLPDRWAGALPGCRCPHPLTLTAAWRLPPEKEVLSQWLGEGNANPGPRLRQGGWGTAWMEPGGAMLNTGGGGSPRNSLRPEVVSTFPRGPFLP